MSHRFIRRAEADELVKKLVSKAIKDRQLIKEGDRILIACSGGKDSTVLAWALSVLRPALKINYFLEAIHIASDFCTECKKTGLGKQLALWDITLNEVEVPIIGRLKPGRKMNCYWCSTQRRMELIRHATENNFNKIALGHHLDDIIETFFMNMINKGKMEAMPILLEYRKFPVSIIRPLAYVEEKQIIACADKFDLLKTACSCPYGVNSGRLEARKKISSLTNDNSAEKRRILASLSSFSKDLLEERSVNSL